MVRKNLQAETLAALYWKFAEKAFSRIVSVLVTLLLARLLVPEDFGLIAMLSVCLALANVFVEGGMSDALIRMDKVDQTAADTVFICNVVTASALFAILFTAAPLIANFYDHPALLELVRVGGISVILSAFANVQQALLTKELAFSSITKAVAPASVISGIIATCCAYQGFGVWSLVTQVLVQSLLTSWFLWMVSSWRPRLRFDFHAYRKIMRFGGYLLLNKAIDIPFRQMHLIVVTKLFSAQEAGFYYFAERVRGLFQDQIVGAVQNVIYPSLASIKSDNQRLVEAYRITVSMGSFLLIPPVLFFVVLAPELVMIAFPPRWQGCELYIQLLLIAGLLYPLHAINLNILKIKGQARLIFRLGLLKKAISIGVLVLSLQWGVLGLMIGQSVGSLIAYILNSYYSSKLLRYAVRTQLADFLPGLLLSTVAALAGHVVLSASALPPGMSVMSATLTMALVYIGLGWRLRLRGMMSTMELIILPSIRKIRKKKTDSAARL